MGLEGQYYCYKKNKWIASELKEGNSLSLMSLLNIVLYFNMTS